MTIAYLENETIYVPEIEIKVCENPRYEYKTLRGFAYVLVVFDKGKCIGWIRIEALGYSSAKEYEESNFAKR